VTGKVVSASSPSKRNLPDVDLRHVFRPIAFSRGFVFHVEFSSKVSGLLRVLGSPGSWTLIIHIHTIESGLQLCSIGDNYTASTRQYFISFFSSPCIAPSLGILSIGESLSLMPPTLIAPGACFAFCCIYSIVMVDFFPGTVHAHSPFLCPSFSHPLIQCFVIVHPLHSTIVSITTSSRLNI